jgi:general secretion pathway protein L
MSGATGSPGLDAGLDRVAALWRWWTAELTAMLPAGLRRRLAAAPPVLLAAPTPEGFRFERLEQGRLQPLARPEPGLPIWLVLPRAALLVKRLDWPLLPAADLRRSLALDLDRQTPFPAEAVRFDIAVVARDAAGGRLTLDLAVTPERWVAPLLADLAERHGIQASRVIGGGPASAPALFDFAAAEAARPPRGLAALLPRLWRTRLLLLCLLLGLLNLALWSGAEGRRLDALDQAVQQARARANSTTNLRRQVEDRHRFIDQLTGGTQAASLLAVLAELTRLMPDDAWLDSLELRGDSVYLVGHATSAAALVRPLERSPLFTEAVFRSPVVPDRASGRERFELTLTLRRPT